MDLKMTLKIFSGKQWLNYSDSSDHCLFLLRVHSGFYPKLTCLHFSECSHIAENYVFKSFSQIVAIVDKSRTTLSGLGTIDTAGSRNCYSPAQSMYTMFEGMCESEFSLFVY